MLASLSSEQVIAILAAFCISSPCDFSHLFCGRLATRSPLRAVHELIILQAELRCRIRLPLKESQVLAFAAHCRHDWSFSTFQPLYQTDIRNSICKNPRSLTKLSLFPGARQRLPLNHQAQLVGRHPESDRLLPDLHQGLQPLLGQCERAPGGLHRLRRRHLQPVHALPGSATAILGPFEQFSRNVSQASVEVFMSESTLRRCLLKCCITRVAS